MTRPSDSSTRVRNIALQSKKSRKLFGIPVPRSWLKICIILILYSYPVLDISLGLYTSYLQGSKPAEKKRVFEFILDYIVLLYFEFVIAITSHICLNHGHELFQFNLKFLRRKSVCLAVFIFLFHLVYDFVFRFFVISDNEQEVWNRRFHFYDIMTLDMSTKWITILNFICMNGQYMILWYQEVVYLMKMSVFHDNIENVISTARKMLEDTTENRTSHINSIIRGLSSCDWFHDKLTREYSAVLSLWITSITFQFTIGFEFLLMEPKSSQNNLYMFYEQLTLVALLLILQIEPSDAAERKKQKIVNILKSILMYDTCLTREENDTLMKYRQFLNDSTFSLSAGGFFHLDRRLLLTLVGLCFTYCLVIKQVYLIQTRG